MSQIRKIISCAAVTGLCLSATAGIDDFKNLDSLQKAYAERESIRYYVMTGVKTLGGIGATGLGIAATAGSFGTLSPWTMPLVGGGIALGLSGLDDLSKMVSSKSLNEQYNSFIYALYKQDSAAFASILKEPDDVKRAKTVLEKIATLDSYKELIPSDPAKRSIYNSAAIVKIIEVTKALAQENIDQNVELKKLESDYASLKKKMESLETKRQVTAFNEALINATLSYAQATDGARRAIASIDQAEIEDIKDPANPKVFTPKDKNFREEYQKFHSYLEQTASYYESAYQIAVNLGLHGKDQERMSKGMAYLNTAISVSRAIATNEPQAYMAAAVSVTGLFAKKSAVDPKHQQIMEAFGKMFEMQTMILKNQQEIYNLQVKNYELLVSLYEFTQKEFIQMNDGLDVILGGQAVLQKQIVDYSKLRSQLESCDEFLNSRLNCPPSELEDPSTIPDCLKRSLKTDFEVPTDKIYYTGVYGQFKNLSSVENHLKNNLEAYYACQEGMATLFPATTSNIHSAFLTSNVVEAGATGYQTIVAKSYLPLMDLAKKYYAKDNDLYLLYVMLLNPSTTLNQYPFKYLNARQWMNSLNTDDSRSLSAKQVQNVLENLIYVPNLEKYVSIELQMLNYMQYVPSSFTTDSNLDPTFLETGLNNSGNRKIADRLFTLEKMVNVAIAQQTLLAGEPFIDKVDFFLQPSNAGTPEAAAALKLLRSNVFFRLNYLKHNLRSALSYSVNRNPALSYEKQLEVNLKLYNEYVTSGYQSCNQANCENVIFKGLSNRYKLSGKKIRFLDKDRGDFTVELPSADFLSNNSFEHTAEMKRLFSLRVLIESYIYKSKTFSDLAIDKNFYAF